MSEASRPRNPRGDDEDEPTEPIARMRAASPDGPDDRPSLIRLFGSRAFFRLWLAQVVSSLGDWIGFVAVTAIAARVGGSSPETAVAIVLSARLVPGFFLAPAAGVFVDRWDRKKVMVSCDIGRGLVLAFLPFVDTIPGLFFAPTQEEARDQARPCRGPGRCAGGLDDPGSRARHRATRGPAASG